MTTMLVWTSVVLVLNVWHAVNNVVDENGSTTVLDAVGRALGTAFVTVPAIFVVGWLLLPVLTP